MYVCKCKTSTVQCCFPHMFAFIASSNPCLDLPKGFLLQLLRNCGQEAPWWPGRWWRFELGKLCASRVCDIEGPPTVPINFVGGGSAQVLGPRLLQGQGRRDMLLPGLPQHPFTRRDTVIRRSTSPSYDKPTNCSDIRSMRSNCLLSAETCCCWRFRQAAAMAASTMSTNPCSQQYTILLLITDGVICDMEK